jgi:hypothetical protein
MSLFGSGSFTLHSGKVSGWKIDCDALTSADWDTLARMAKLIVGPYSAVKSPGGAGNKFAQALNRYCDRGPLLLADDVLTSATTLWAMKNENERPGIDRVKGIVVFARGPLPYWVDAIFKADNRLWGF